MDVSNKEEDELDEDVANYNPQGRWDKLTNPVSYEVRDENLLQIRRSWEGVGAIHYPNELSDEDNRSLLNLQRLSLEHRSPFPDFQFELLDNEADTDGSGCELNLATGTRRKFPSRGDSCEDNWLFQKRSPRGQPTESIDFNLVSARAVDELSDTPIDDIDNNDSDDSECSKEDKWDDIRRVERPCVQTSSSSSASGDSESMTSDSPSENNEKDLDEEVPILDGNHSMTDSPDSEKAKLQTPVNSTINDSEDEEYTNDKCDEKVESDSSSVDTSLGIKKEIEDFRRRILKTSEVEVMSDDSIKNEVLKHKGEKATLSRPVNPLLPLLLARHTPSPSGTRSCESDDSSGEEFEKKVAAYKQRRRASWCPLEGSSAKTKKKSKRRPLQQPRLDEEEPELDIEVAPLVNHEEALVGLERQMLHRDVHHSSFRAKKASPNFVVNPLYVPDGDVAQNHRRDPIEEPVEMHQLRPQRAESGYSSCSPDSYTKKNNQNPILPVERSPSAEGRFNEAVPLDERRQHPSSSNHPLAKPDSSFLW